MQTRNNDNSNYTKVTIHSAYVPVCPISENFREFLFLNTELSLKAGVEQALISFVNLIVDAIMMRSLHQN